MKSTIIQGLAVSALSLTTFALIAPSQVSAKTTLRYYQDIKNATYTVTNKNATVYTTGTLKHKKGTMASFGTKVTGYYAAHLTKNGKSSVYYKFKVGNKTGWVWHGYLSKQAANKPVTKTEAFDEAKVDAHLLDLVNEQRVKNGTQPVTVDQNLFNTVTMVRAKQIETSFEHEDENGNFIADDLATANNIDHSYFSENIANYYFDETNIKTADNIFYGYFYDDAESDWGHKENILSPEVTRVAIATISHAGRLYNVMNFYYPSNDSNVTYE